MDFDFYLIRVELKKIALYKKKDMERNYKDIIKIMSREARID